jgi:putative ABC transport system permease protein
MADASSRLISFLLLLYPRRYRARAGAELSASMAACLARERQAGRPAAATAVRLTLDAVHAAWLVRRDARQRAVFTRRLSQQKDSHMASWLHDLRDAVRLLRRAPLFSALVIGTLALAIAANTAIFSLVNAVLLRALPYRSPDRLVLLYIGSSAFDRPFGFSAPDFAAFRERARSYEAIAAFRSVEYELSGVDTPERISAAKISAPLFDVLGVVPAIGRPFTVEEDEGRRPVAILSDRLWRRKFGADREIAGKKLLLDRQAYTIVGVAPRGFVFPNRGPVLNDVPADVYVPIGFTTIEMRAFGSMYNNSVIARLKPDVSLAQAAAEGAAMAKRIVAEVYPAQLREFGSTLIVTTHALRDQIVGGVSRILYVLLAAVGVVLLIAAADIAGLMLTRAASRERELAVRAALGAGRLRLIRMMLTEAGVLAALGGAIGVALAWWGSQVLLKASPVELPRAHEVSFDRGVFLFSLSVTAIAAIVCGLVPAWEASRRQAGTTLKESGRTSTASARQRRIFGALVTAQFAMSIVLLASGGLLIRSVMRLLATDPGIKTDNVMSLAISLPATTYPGGPNVRSFYGRLLERVAQIPGVVDAGTSTSLPLAVRERRAFTIENPSAASERLPHVLAHDWVAGGYFNALGIRVISGRALDLQDTDSSEPVVVVNETMAKRYWDGADPVGRRMAWGNARIHAPWMRVVGVVADVKMAGVSAPTEPQTWTPWVQVPDGMLADTIIGAFRNLKLVVRGGVPPATLVSGIREQVRAIDPSLPVTNPQLLDDLLSESTGPQRFNAAVLGGFAAAALLLASLGVAGVLAISVSRRTQEIGVRLALGARSGDVLRMVLRQGLTMVALGLAIGLPCAFAATRLLASLLFGVGTHDPVAFGGATGVLVLVAVAACAAPAIRASRVDPITALRID